MNAKKAKVWHKSKHPRPPKQAKAADDVETDAEAAFLGPALGPLGGGFRRSVLGHVVRYGGVHGQTMSNGFCRP